MILYIVQGKSKDGYFTPRKDSHKPFLLTKGERLKLGAR